MDKCPLCLDNVEENPTKMPGCECSFIFHQKCHDEMIEKRFGCPICAKNKPMQNIQNIQQDFFNSLDGYSFPTDNMVIFTSIIVVIAILLFIHLLIKSRDFHKLCPKMIFTVCLITGLLTTFAITYYLLLYQN